jgi:hypothetical protein
MKKLAIAFAVGAAALLGGSAANAADNTAKLTASTDVSASTDMSARKRVRVRHVQRSYRTYDDSYAYDPAPYYGGGYAPRSYGGYDGYGPQHYGGGGPSIGFSFGGGGGGWGGHHNHW